MLVLPAMIRAAIASFIFVIYCCNLCLCRFILVWRLHLFQMVVECRTGELSDCKQNLQFIFLPQFLNYLRFLRRRCSSSQTKTCKFFRDSASSLSRCTSASKSHSASLGAFLRLSASAPLSRKSFQPFREIDSIPKQFAYGH